MKIQVFFTSSLVLLLLILGTSKVAAQINISGHGDCDKALLIATDKVWGPSLPPVGCGKVNELNDPSGKSPFSFEKEHNTVWYEFEAPYNAVMTFEIIPVDARDDYDFLLFKKEDNSCDQIARGIQKPLRSNIARNNKALKSITGLSAKATQEYVHSGPGNNFSKAIEVKKGERFLLVVDNVYAGGSGHSIKFNFERIKPSIDKVFAKESGKVPVVIRCSDAQSKQPLKVNLIAALIDTESGDTLKTEMTDLSEKLVFAEFGKEYFFRAAKEGYTYTSQSIRVKQYDTIYVDLKLNHLKKGTRFDINTIYFVGNKAEILEQSKPALRDLLNSLQDNPQVSIIIVGHVNAPNQPNNEELQKLSEDRAKAVADYLIQNGISEKRIEHRGMGNTNMLYPTAQSEELQKLNRRVEIFVK